MTKTIAEVLDEAADLVEAAPKLAKGTMRAPVDTLNENGRVVGSVGKGPNCYCTIGAVETAMGIGSGDDDAWLKSKRVAEALCDYLNLEAYPSAHSAVYKWNDADARTKDEVAQALRGAAALRMSRQS